MTYHSYCQCLKAHLANDELKQMGVLPWDYSTHSFRIGGLSIMNADEVVTPTFTKKNAPQKRIDSTLNYCHSTMGEALQASNVLSGND